MGWSNWAGDQSCRPAEVVHPATREELVEAVAGAVAAGTKVKVPGSGHSFAEAALTDGTMIRIEALDRVLEADTGSGLVKVEAGIVLRQLNRELALRGLALPNLGDIDKQTIAGAISTATHGTGAKLQNISAAVAAVEIVTGDGQVRELSAEARPEELRAARVSLGALGAIYSVTLRAVPAFRLHRVDEPQPLELVLTGFEELAETNDHFEFFVFPYTDSALTIRRNRTDGPAKPRSRPSVFLNETVLQNTVGALMMRLTRAVPALIPRVTRFAGRMMSEGDYVDDSYRIFSSERSIRFTEMEYAIPREHGPAAVRRVLDWISENRYSVAFPIEYRVVGPDDALLSPSHERPTVYIAVHQYRGMEWRPYFEAVEAIMGEYGGRPHWGKRHHLTHETLAGRYPRFGEFLAMRDRFDPDRVFANAYTARCLGP
jgi:L-gulonolactone oxidase